MKNVTLTLNVQELQTVFQALSTQPYIQVHELIGKLQQQAAPQLQNIKEEENSPSAVKDDTKTEETV